MEIPLIMPNIHGPYSVPIKFEFAAPKGFYTHPASQGIEGWGEPHVDEAENQIPPPGTPGGENQIRYIHRDLSTTDATDWLVEKIPGNWVYGPIDWRGEEGEDADGNTIRERLTFHGPQARYFKEDQFVYGSIEEHEDIYGRGGYMGIAPLPVLGAAVQNVDLGEDSEGNPQKRSYLIAVCKDGLEDVVYVKPKEPNISPAAFDLLTRSELKKLYVEELVPNGWTEVGRIPNWTGGNGSIGKDADTPWFFNPAGTEAQCLRPSTYIFNNGQEVVTEEDAKVRLKLTLTITDVLDSPPANLAHEAIEPVHMIFAFKQGHWISPYSTTYLMLQSYITVWGTSAHPTYGDTRPVVAVDYDDAGDEVVCTAFHFNKLWSREANGTDEGNNTVFTTGGILPNDGHSGADSPRKTILEGTRLFVNDQPFIWMRNRLPLLEDGKINIYGKESQDPEAAALPSAPDYDPYRFSYTNWITDPSPELHGSTNPSRDIMPSVPNYEWGGRYHSRNRIDHMDTRLLHHMDIRRPDNLFALYTEKIESRFLGSNRAEDNNKSYTVKYDEGPAETQSELETRYRIISTIKQGTAAMQETIHDQWLEGEAEPGEGIPNPTFTLGITVGMDKPTQVWNTHASEMAAIYAPAYGAGSNQPDSTSQFFDFQRVGTTSGGWPDNHDAGTSTVTTSYGVQTIFPPMAHVLSLTPGHPIVVNNGDDPVTYTKTVLNIHQILANPDATVVGNAAMDDNGDVCISMVYRKNGVDEILNYITDSDMNTLVGDGEWFYPIGIAG